jgi:hypothetical protein
MTNRLRWVAALGVVSFAVAALAAQPFVLAAVDGPSFGTTVGGFPGSLDVLWIRPRPFAFEASGIFKPMPGSMGIPLRARYFPVTPWVGIFVVTSPGIDGQLLGWMRADSKGRVTFASSLSRLDLSQDAVRADTGLELTGALSGSAHWAEGEKHATVELQGDRVLLKGGVVNVTIVMHGVESIQLDLPRVDWGDISAKLSEGDLSLTTDGADLKSSLVGPLDLLTTNCDLLLTLSPTSAFLARIGLIGTAFGLMRPCPDADHRCLSITQTAGHLKAR